jgi:GMP synthase (glutamine-hydrolysing)
VRKAILIRHVAFEDAGNLAEVLRQRDYHVEYVEAGSMDLTRVEPCGPALLGVLGGPISVNDQEDFPCIEQELALLRARMRADLPTLGICLGAQLMARAQGARVFRGARKELGWAPLTLSKEGARTALGQLAGSGVRVLHWHGETFELPRGATLLASTEDCPHQAFSWGQRGLALQFHPEVTLSGLERWFIGHIAEIASTPGVSVGQLRRDTALHAPALQPRARALWHDWLTAVGL